ncbi:MAG: zf-HC2 domain-containing protein, partial [Longimicrobiales bacterium]
MHDPWIEKLSDHIDGLLNDADARALAEHLADCAEC